MASLTTAVVCREPFLNAWYASPWKSPRRRACKPLHLVAANLLIPRPGSRTTEEESLMPPLVQDSLCTASICLPPRDSPQSSRRHLARRAKTATVSCVPPSPRVGCLTLDFCGWQPSCPNILHASYMKISFLAVLPRKSCSLVVRYKAQCYSECRMLWVYPG
jgi:hypothetical protein